MASSNPPAVVPTSTVNIVQPLVEALQRYNEQPNVQAQAGLSRARFAITQISSMVITVLTCITLCIIALTKVENVQDLLTGRCSLANMLIKNLTGITDNYTCPAPI
jgi:hypothetical protein